MMSAEDNEIKDLPPITLNLPDDDQSNSDNDILEEDSVETEARSMGWKPLEEWEGPKIKWRSAKEFVDRDSFFKKIESQNKVIRELQDSLRQLGSHQAKLAQVEREKVLKELKLQKKEAFESQDYEALEAADEQIAALEAAPIPEVKVPQTQDVDENNRLFEDFKRRNEWYDSDPELRDFADTLATGYAAKQKLANKPVTATELFDYIEKQVTKQNKVQQKRAPDPVTGATNTTSTKSGGNGKRFTTANLNETQRRFAKRFVEMGAFKNEQEYVDSLVKTGELG